VPFFFVCSFSFHPNEPFTFLLSFLSGILCYVILGVITVTIAIVTLFINFAFSIFDNLSSYLFHFTAAAVYMVVALTLQAGDSDMVSLTLTHYYVMMPRSFGSRMMMLAK